MPRTEAAWLEGGTEREWLEGLRPEDRETCEAARFDADGNTVFECDDPNYEEFDMPDGGVVRLCRRHASWAPAMGRGEGSHGR